MGNRFVVPVHKQARSQTYIDVRDLFSSERMVHMFKCVSALQKESQLSQRRMRSSRLGVIFQLRFNRKRFADVAHCRSEFPFPAQRQVGEFRGKAAYLR